MDNLFADYDKTLPPINGFRDEFSFLSNMHVCEVEYKGIKFISSEQAYVWAKTDNLIQQHAILNLTKQGDIKRYGTKLTLIKNWKRLRYFIMVDIIDCKFKHGSLLATKLLETGNRYIEETNWWKDDYWGVCDGVGENNIGFILMLRRSQLRDMNG